MEPVPLTKISHAAAWTSDELSQRNGEWVYLLTESDLRELDQAMADLKTAGKEIPNFDKDDFHVPSLMGKLQPMIERLDTGLGILQIVGMPPEKYSKDQARPFSGGWARTLGALGNRMQTVMCWEMFAIQGNKSLTLVLGVTKLMWKWSSTPILQT